MNAKVQIIILAAGKGKRMNSETPKVLMPFNGKPMIDYLMDAVDHSGIQSKPILVVGYKKEEVINHIGDRAIYVNQEEQLGTGHAVKVTEESIANDVENIIVLYGDAPAITGAMIANLLSTHEKSGCMLTMATVVVPSFEDWYKVFYTPFSRIIRSENGKIERSVEFKDASEEEKQITELNPCYFCFNKEWLYKHLALIRNENMQSEYYLTDLIHYAAVEGSIASVHISPEEALGVNTIEELEHLEKIVKK